MDRLSQEYSHKLYQLYNPLSDYHLQKKPFSEEPDGEEIPTNSDIPQQSGVDLDTKVKSKAGELKPKHLPSKKEKDSAPMVANFVLKH